MKPEYLIEAGALGMFMVSAAFVAAGVEHPDSPVRAAIADPVLRRALIGLGMGLTAVLLIYSPLGKRSGAHMNPSVTLTFWRLGKVANADAAAYVLAQFAGAVLGLTAAFLILGDRLAGVNFVATRPGPAGPLVAVAAEAFISFLVMTVVLGSTGTARLAPYTGLLVGALVALYITVEEPLSGMSMNPARTFAPWVVGGVATPLWVYFIGPPVGMLAAGELYVRLRGMNRVACAKLQHPPTGRCIFGCEAAATTPDATLPRPAHPTSQRPSTKTSATRPEPELRV